jgi:hypothetical protein
VGQCWEEHKTVEHIVKTELAQDRVQMELKYLPFTSFIAGGCAGAVLPTFQFLALFAVVAKFCIFNKLVLPYRVHLLLMRVTLLQMNKV